MGPTIIILWPWNVIGNLKFQMGLDGTFVVYPQP
jgi:hypothetical protein